MGEKVSLLPKAHVTSGALKRSAFLVDRLNVSLEVVFSAKGSMAESTCKGTFPFVNGLGVCGEVVLLREKDIAEFTLEWSLLLMHCTLMSTREQ